MELVTKKLLDWYQNNARDLPWRKKSGPYEVWISEIMLQQTRVEAVKEYYRRFLERLPKVEDLACVPEDELMKLWQGLGYYNRARNLQKAAQVIVSQYNGKFPAEYEELLKLPGIGEYTAGAIASIAFNEKVPAVDGNVYRIYTRLTRDDSDVTKAPVKRKIREEIQKLVPDKEAGKFTQAWMDLGSAICIPNGEPLCSKCPLQKECQAAKEGDMLMYPVKPAKKTRKQEKKTIILFEYQGKYLIQKRPPRGLLAGLWEFPSQEGNLSLKNMTDALAEIDVDNEKIELAGKAKHVFSHIEWHMLGYVIHLQKMPDALVQKEMVWATREELKTIYSIPSAFRFYYEHIMDELT